MKTITYKNRYTTYHSLWAVTLIARAFGAPWRAPAPSLSKFTSFNPIKFADWCSVSVVLENFQKLSTRQVHLWLGFHCFHVILFELKVLKRSKLFELIMSWLLKKSDSWILTYFTQYLKKVMPVPTLILIWAKP